MTTDKLAEAWAALEALPYLVVTGIMDATEREHEKGMERALAGFGGAGTGWYIDAQALREKVRALALAVHEVNCGICQIEGFNRPAYCREHRRILALGTKKRPDHEARSGEAGDG